MKARAECRANYKNRQKQPQSRKKRKFASLRRVCMTDLCVDIGNSRTKLGFFEEGVLKAHFSVSSNNPNEWAALLSDSPSFSRAVVSSVGLPHCPLTEAVKARSHYFLSMESHTPLPFRNGYKTPATLGKDRLCAAAGAHFLHGGTPLLVVDAGTALTIDLTSCEGDFLGGVISPGLRMRAEALHHYTRRLPLASLTTIPHYPPVNTADALNGGILQGILFETEGYIDRCRQQCPDLQVVATGGDLWLFEKFLNYHIFAEPHLVLYGLFRILIYNANL